MEFPSYPTTHHIEGSAGIPTGGGRVPIASLRGRQATIEEKIDGDMIGFGFDAGASLILCAHGAIVAEDDRRFLPAWRWARAREDALFDVMGDRYVAYAECMAWKHAVFYDALPDAVIEYDVYDRSTGAWLDTDSRREILAPLGVVSVPVLASGPLDGDALSSLLRPSAYRSSGWRDVLALSAREAGASSEEAMAGTDPSDLPEGLYVKIEEGGRVVARLKWIRPGFLSAVASHGHWRSRPMIRNRLASGQAVL